MPRSRPEKAFSPPGNVPSNFSDPGCHFYLGGHCRCPCLLIGMESFSFFQSSCSSTVLSVSRSAPRNLSRLEFFGKQEDSHLFVLHVSLKELPPAAATDFTFFFSLGAAMWLCPADALFVIARRDERGLPGPSFHPLFFPFSFRIPNPPPNFFFSPPTPLSQAEQHVKVIP